MQQCEYCGKNNEAAALYCSGCGTPFLEPDIQAEAGEQGNTSQLNASRATNILLVYLAAQFVTSIIVGAACVSSAVAKGMQLKDPQEIAKFTKDIMPIIVPAAVLGGGLAGVLVSFLLARTQLRDCSPFGAAWTLGSIRDLRRGLLFGVQAGVVYVTLSGIAVSLGFPHTTRGQLATMAITPGLSHLVWLVSILVFAPPLEELLFRGVLYSGYRQSFGHLKAAVITTALFSLLHVAEWIHFLPALIGITGLAILALWVRLRSAAIGPAIALHFGYNATLAGLLSVALALSSSK